MDSYHETNKEALIWLSPVLLSTYETAAAL